ncbi:MAG: hypothetical protein Rubg2KO_14590 [Rubricoccaceae bacterium]
MMTRLLLLSLIACLVGLASGCDSGADLQSIGDNDGDSTYVPVQIEGTIGFLTDGCDGQECRSSWVRMDVKTGAERSRTSLGALNTPGDLGATRYPIRVAESPDGMRLATVTNDCAECSDRIEGLYVSGANASTPIRIVRETWLQPVTWSPDNRRLLFANAQVAELTDTDTLAGPPLCVWCKAFPNASPDVYLRIRGAWSEDSNTLLLFVPTEPGSSEPAGVHLYEVDLRAPESPRQLTSTPIAGMFSHEPGGEHVIASLSHAQYELVNLTTGESRSFALPMTEGLQIRVHSMLWNSGGRFLFVHYTQGPSQDRSDVHSNHVGLFDTEDPELRWQPLAEVLPHVIPDHATITLFVVLQPDA